MMTTVGFENARRIFNMGSKVKDGFFLVFPSYVNDNVIYNPKRS